MDWTAFRIAPRQLVSGVAWEKWVSLFLLLLLLWNLALLTWQVADGDSSAPVSANISGVTTADPAVSVAATSLLANPSVTQLFGRSEVTQLPALPVDIPESRQRLRLKGVIAGSEGNSLSAAWIADDRGNEKAYRMGDALPGGGELVKILSDRVILRISGRHEMLSLPKDSLSNMTTVSQSPRSAPVVEVVDEPLTADEFAPFIESWSQNPTAMLDVLRMRPISENGVVTGVALFPRQEAELFRRAGLLPGDVVTSINGLSLSEVSDVASLVSQMSAVDRLQLEIQRGGNAVYVDLPVN